MTVEFWDDEHVLKFDCGDDAQHCEYSLKKNYGIVHFKRVTCTVLSYISI